MRRLIPIILVVGVFFTACGGGGEKAETSVAGTTLAEESPVPMEVVAPTSVATTTLVPTAASTATPVPTPTPTSEPEPSLEYGPSPMINLTIVYPDGGSITVPITCPVPAEFCETGVDLYDENGDYLGLGFSLPAGTPIFAIVADGHYETIRAFQTFDYKIANDVYFHRIETRLMSASRRREDSYIYKPNRCNTDVSVRYDYSGFSDLDKAFDQFYEIRPEAGEELGRVNDPSTSLLGIYFKDTYKADGQRMDGVNFIFWVETWWGHTEDKCVNATLRIDLNCQPSLTSESTPEPTPVSQSDLAVALPDGSEVPIAWPVPGEYHDSAVEVYDAGGNYIGLGFHLPGGTSVFAVTNGELGDYRFNPTQDENGVYVYTFGFDLQGAKINFFYTYTGFSSVFLNPTIMSGVPYFPSPPTIEVSEEQELGTIVDRDPTAITAYEADGQAISGINLLIAARSPTQGTLRICVK